LDVFIPDGLDVADWVRTPAVARRQCGYCRNCAVSSTHPARLEEVVDQPVTLAA
jgi:hypothetical protein